LSKKADKNETIKLSNGFTKHSPDADACKSPKETPEKTKYPQSEVSNDNQTPLFAPTVVECESKLSKNADKTDTSALSNGYTNRPVVIVGDISKSQNEVISHKKSRFNPTVIECERTSSKKVHRIETTLLRGKEPSIVQDCKISGESLPNGDMNDPSVDYSGCPPKKYPCTITDTTRPVPGLCSPRILKNNESSPQKLQEIVSSPMVSQENLSSPKAYHENHSARKKLFEGNKTSPKKSEEKQSPPKKPEEKQSSPKKPEEKQSSPKKQADKQSSPKKLEEKSQGNQSCAAKFSENHSFQRKTQEDQSFPKKSQGTREEVKVLPTNEYASHNGHKPGQDYKKFGEKSDLKNSFNGFKRCHPDDNNNLDLPVKKKSRNAEQEQCAGTLNWRVESLKDERVRLVTPVGVEINGTTPWIVAPLENPSDETKSEDSLKIKYKRDRRDLNITAIGCESPSVGCDNIENNEEFLSKKKKKKRKHKNQDREDETGVISKDTAVSPPSDCDGTKGNNEEGLSKKKRNQNRQDADVVSVDSELTHGSTDKIVAPGHENDTLGCDGNGDVLSTKKRKHKRRNRENGVVLSVDNEETHHLGDESALYSSETSLPDHGTRKPGNREVTHLETVTVSCDVNGDVLSKKKRKHKRRRNRENADVMSVDNGRTHHLGNESAMSSQETFTPGHETIEPGHRKATSVPEAVGVAHAEVNPVVDSLVTKKDKRKRSLQNGEYGFDNFI